MKELDYKTDLEIDPDALDVEWLNQAQTFMKYAVEATEARAKLDRAKENLDVVKAEQDAIVRAELTKAGGKVTEAIVYSAIIQKPAYREASENVIEKKYDADLLISAVRAFDQRKETLENLVRLQGQQYFAGPTEPRDLSREATKRIKQKEAKDVVKEHMRHRTK